MDLAAMKAKIGKAKEKKGASGGFAKTAFLPEGKHKVRILMDPKEELFRECRTYGFGRNAMVDPRDVPKENLPEGFVNELPGLEEKLDHWKGKGMYNFIVPIYLIETNRPGDYWEPGHIYYVTGNGKFKTAYLKFIESLIENSQDYFRTFINPELTGGIVEIDLTKGTGSDAGCQFNPVMGGTHGPVDITKGYVDLDKVLAVKDEFDQEKYDSVKERLEKLVAEQEQRKASESAENKEAAEQAVAESNADNESMVDGDPAKTDVKEEPAKETNAAVTENAEPAKDVKAEEPKPEVKEEVKPEPTKEAPAETPAEAKEEAKPETTVGAGNTSTEVADEDDPWADVFGDAENQ